MPLRDPQRRRASRPRTAHAPNAPWDFWIEGIDPLLDLDIDHDVFVPQDWEDIAPLHDDHYAGRDSVEEVGMQNDKGVHFNLPWVLPTPFTSYPPRRLHRRPQSAPPAVVSHREPFYWGDILVDSGSFHLLYFSSTRDFEREHVLVESMAGLQVGDSHIIRSLFSS